MAGGIGSIAAAAAGSVAIPVIGWAVVGAVSFGAVGWGVYKASAWGVSKFVERNKLRQATGETPSTWHEDDPEISLPEGA